MKHLIFIIPFLFILFSCEDSSSKNDESGINDEDAAAADADADADITDEETALDFSLQTAELNEKTVRDSISCAGMVFICGESDGKAYLTGFNSGKEKWRIFLDDQAVQSINALACGNKETDTYFLLAGGDRSKGTESPQTGFIMSFNPETGALIDTIEIDNGTSVSVYALTTDSEMNIFAGGRVEGAFEGGIEEYGGKDGFIVKYNHQGEKQFLTRFGTPEFDSVQGLTIGSDGYLLAAGYSGGNIETGAAGNDSENMKGFVIKFKPDGLTHWKKMYDATHFWKISAPLIYSFFVAGSMKKDGKSVAVIYQMGLDGKIKSVYSFPAEGNSVATGFDFDPDKNIYITGHMEGNFVNGGKIPPESNELPAKNNLFLGIFNTTTTRFLYGKVFGTESHDINSKISIDSGSSPYISFYSLEELTGSSGKATVAIFEKVE
jgi:hypothetical protein